MMTSKTKSERITKAEFDSSELSTIRFCLEYRKSILQKGLLEIEFSPESRKYWEAEAESIESILKKSF